MSSQERKLGVKPTTGFSEDLFVDDGMGGVLHLYNSRESRKVNTIVVMFTCRNAMVDSDAMLSPVDLHAHTKPANAEFQNFPNTSNLV